MTYIRLLFIANLVYLVLASGVLLFGIYLLFSSGGIKQEDRKEILKAVRSQIPRRGKLNAYVEDVYFYWQCPVCGHINKEKLEAQGGITYLKKEWVLICRECLTGLVYKHETGKYRLPGKESKK
ncbi:hypothetical protein DRQ17_00480 [bacterium]|nr:MAG: hypothetical protein DRQ17_00480 [bacterium]